MCKKEKTTNKHLTNGLTADGVTAALHRSPGAVRGPRKEGDLLLQSLLTCIIHTLSEPTHKPLTLYIIGAQFSEVRETMKD